jgi:hypothetical protein
MPAYVTCPRCKRSPIGLKKNGEMKLHRTDVGYFGPGTLFPYCPCAGCTPEEATKGITFLIKRRAEFEKQGGLEGAIVRMKKRRERNAKREAERASNAEVHPMDSRGRKSGT